MSETSTETIERQRARGAGLYRIIWKWHFLTSLVVLQFMVFMAVTGAINLFHDDLNDILYADALSVSPEGDVLPWEDLAAAAQAEVPGRVVEFHTSDDPARAMVFEVDTEAGRNIAWVNLTPPKFKAVQ